MPRPDTDLPPARDYDPRERQLARRSRTPTVAVGLVIAGLIMLAGLIYAASAVLV